MDPLISALHQNFGWNSYKPGQRPIIEEILSGRDVLAILPTGGGKSLCYQLPALVKQGLVVVISPLVALMEDQVKQLRNRGIEAAFLHSGLELNQRRDVYQALNENKIRLLYIAPERLKHERTRQFLAKKSKCGELVALAIDEAHCISSWGHDFRPEYRRLGELRTLCPGIPLIALSRISLTR